MTALRLTRPADVDAFEALAGPFLTAREAEHNLMLGICTNLKSRPYGTLPPYFAVITKGDRVVASALRTPPFNLVLSAVDEPAALPLLADDVVASTPICRACWARRRPHASSPIGGWTHANGDRSSGRTTVARCRSAA